MKRPETTFPPARAWLRTLARAWVLLAALCAVLLALAFALGTERTGWIELLRYVPYPAWLLPALAGVALSVLLGWRWRVVALLTLLLVLTRLMGFSAGLGSQAQGQEGQAQRPVRLMTYNIKSYRAAWRDEGYAALAGEIGRRDPDILVMQDAQEFSRLLPSGQPAGLPDELRAVLPGREIRSHGQYTIASRFPVRDCGRGEMPYGGRSHGFLRCTVQIGSTALSLVTAHTLSPREGLNATRGERLQGLDDWQRNFADRMGQAQALARAAATLPRPLILAGDLNAPEHSPVVQVLLATGLRDAFSAAGLGWGYTLGHALKPGISFVRLDHVLVSPDIGVQRTTVGGSEASEHRPVMADLWVAQ